MITSVLQEGVPGIVLPEAANLSFQCGPLLEDRLAELRKQLPAPPPAKRPRTGTGVLVGAPADLPTTTSADKLLESCTLIKSTTHKVGEPPVTFTIFRAARKTDGLIVNYIQNTSSIRLTLPAQAHFCNSSRGTFFDRMNDAQKAAINEDQIQWAWDVTGSTLFAFSFAGSDDVVDLFQNMFDSARLAAASQQLALYGHNAVESADRGAIQKTRVVPHRRTTADVALQLKKPLDSQFVPENLGDFFQLHDLRHEGALLLPAWRVRMTAAFSVDFASCG